MACQRKESLEGSVEGGMVGGTVCLAITTIDLSSLSLRIEASFNGAPIRLLHACHATLHNRYGPGRHPTPEGLSSEVWHGPQAHSDSGREHYYCR
jgi:hypothetical protein